jgi:hypothetical protein
MGKIRTTVVLDEDLLKKAKAIAQTDQTNTTITHILEDYVRRASLKKLAGLLGTDPEFGTTPRRRGGTSE